MELKQRISLFEPELNQIKDANVRIFTERVLGLLPDYFFVIPASSTGKYHPEFAAGDEGLVRHTKMVVKLFTDLWTVFSYGIPENEAKQKAHSLCISAIILHDGLKKGIIEQTYTTKTHDADMAKYILDLADGNAVGGIIPMKEAQQISDLIFTHLGQWGNNPESPFQKLVHLADYMASRKYTLYMPLEK